MLRQKRRQRPTEVGEPTAKRHLTHNVREVEHEMSKLRVRSPKKLKNLESEGVDRCLAEIENLSFDSDRRRKVSAGRLVQREADTNRKKRKKILCLELAEGCDILVNCMTQCLAEPMAHDGQIIPFTSPMTFAREVMFKILLSSNHQEVWLATRDGTFFRVRIELPREQIWPKQLAPVDERSQGFEPASGMTIEEIDMDAVDDAEAMDLDIRKVSMSQLAEAGRFSAMPPLSAGRHVT
jgi:hypothetical protein